MHAVKNCQQSRWERELSNESDTGWEKLKDAIYT